VFFLAGPQPYLELVECRGLGLARGRMSHRSGALSQAGQVGSQRCVVLPVLSTQSRKRTNVVLLRLESPKLSRIKRLCLKLELSPASEEPTCDMYGYTYVVRQGEYSVLTKSSMQRCHELKVGYIHHVAQLRRAVSCLSRFFGPEYLLVTSIFYPSSPLLKIRFDCV
jgi:hypothetical protein